MPRLLSNRKPVARPEELKGDRWEYLNLQNAQPAIGPAPVANTGYTLQSDELGRITWTDTLGRLQFQEQEIKATEAGVDISITGIETESNIVLTPFQTAFIDGDLRVQGEAQVNGNFRVDGIPLGTFPIVQNTLYVTPDGNDLNDGSAFDATRACRTISGAVRSPLYQPGTTIRVAAGTYFEDNPIPLEPYTSVVGNDLRTTFVEPLNKDLDLFHVNSGVYIAQMQMRNLRRGSVERYAPGGQGTYTTGAYCVAFPPSLENPIDLYHSPYIQNCTNQTGPWLKDGTMFIPNQTVQVPLAAGVSSWEAEQNSIVVSIYTGTVTVGMAINDAANEGYRNAQLILLKNKEFLQTQTVGYVDATFPNFEYDKEKCFRDVGFIIDAVSGDARFGGNKRSKEAGLAYFLGNQSLIEGQEGQTIAAINYLKTISQQIIVNTTVTNTFDEEVLQVIDLNLDNGSVVSTRLENSFGIITNIIANGPSSAPTVVQDLTGLIFPTGLSANEVNTASVVTSITTISEGVYEIGLSRPTVSASDNATVYFGNTSVYPILDADIPNQWTVNDGDRFVDRRLDPTGAGGGALVDGNAPSLKSPIQSFVFDAFTQVNQGGVGIHIINNGYAQLVSVFTIMCSNAVIVENGGIASITNSNSNFGDTCLTAKGLGKLAYQGFVVNPAFPTNRPNGEFYPLGFWPQRQEMGVFLPSERDRPHIGQVMEVVPPDTYINFEGVRVPYINSVGYPGYLIASSTTGTITAGSFEIDNIDVTNVAVGHTLYIRDVLGNEGPEGSTTNYVTTGTQVVDVQYRKVILDRPILTGIDEPNNPSFLNLYFCGNAYYTVLSSRIDTTLASTVTTEVTLVPGQETTTSLAISYAKSLALRVIQNEEITGFVYDQAKCKRDTGLIVDSIALDLIYPTDELSQSNFAGLQYWNQHEYVGTIANELTTTTNAIRFVKEISQEVIRGITTGTRYQSTVTQNIALPTGTVVESEIVADNFDLILDIIIDGTSGVTDRIVPNGTASNNTSTVRAYEILIANRAYIQAEAIAFVEATKESGFVYDQSLCHRDVGYMIDSVAFDLLHGGNKQSVQSGVYYYGFEESLSAIDGQIPQTAQAYQYIRDLIPFVVRAISTQTYQTFVPQVTNLPPAGTNEVVQLQAFIDHIVDIIDNGPSAANDKVPISLDLTNEPNEINAYNLLIANRAFIKEEVIAYINATNDLGTYQNEYLQIFDETLDGGERAVDSLAEKFDIIATIIKDGAGASPEIVRPRQYVDFDQGILNAKKLLDKNRLFIQAETVAFVDSIWPSKFSYDPAKCSRDTGLIVDAIAQDLLFDGVSQSTFAGLQYWNQGMTVIPGEQTTTTNAVKHLRELAKKVVLNQPVGYLYQNTVTQVTSATTSTAIISREIEKDFNVIIDLLENGTDGITDKIVPNGLNARTDTSVTIAYELLQQNKEFLQHEVVAWVEANANLEYDQVKCERDTGFIVDAIAFDLMYPTENDSQSTFAGLQYWSQDEYVDDIENEITTTTNAIIYLSSIAQKVIVNNTNTVARYQTEVVQVTSETPGTPTEAALVGQKFGEILDILENGVVGSSDKIVPNGRPSINTATINAYNLLLANKEYLVEEVIAYVEDTKAEEFEYDETLCRRDVGYMIDSVAFDLLHGGNKQSIQSGVYYYDHNADQTVIVGEIPATTAAYNRIKEILPSILSGVKITPSEGNTEPQVTYMLPSNRQQIQKAIAKVDKIINIINNGPGVAGEKTPISLEGDNDPFVDRAFDLLIANRNFIKKEIVSFINQNFTGFVYDKELCFRDVGFMVDSVSFDILYGGNKQAVQSGVYYYGYESDESAIEGEIPQTAAAYNFIERLVGDIITGNEVEALNQTKVLQVISTFTGTISEVQQVRDSVNLINRIIEKGPSQAGAKEPISLERSTSTSVINAAILLNQNRDFIKAETIAFINNTYNTGFLYDKSKCRRDTGLIVDSIAFDLLHEGLTESTFAGLQYWNQAEYTGTIQSEITTTTNAIRYIKELVQKVVVNDVIPVSTGNTSTQVLDLPESTVSISRSIGANVDVILDILQNGTLGVTDKIVPNGKESTNIDIQNAYDILRLNKTFIQNEVIARINIDNTEFDYDRDTCRRDVGYIVDSLSFDLLHGGNRQSVASGVYYYGFDAADTVIDDQVPQTTEAYNYIREITERIVKSQALPKLYQRKVPQVFSDNVASDDEVVAIQEKIDNITNIINNGPDVAPEKQPISMVASTDEQVINAFNLLLANRAFIQAEVIAYIDAKFTDAQNYDRNKCFRDMGAVVDAVGYDLVYGGNYNSVNTGNGYFLRKGQYHIVRMEQNVGDPTLFIDGATVRFYQQSYISASGYLFEYVGAGTQYGALPQVGTADPVQGKEVVQLNNGKVFFTSTDQNGDFRIGPTLVISQSTGVLSGRTFQKSLFAEMTPFILVVGA